MSVPFHFATGPFTSALFPRPIVVPCTSLPHESDAPRWQHLSAMQHTSPFSFRQSTSFSAMRVTPVSFPFFTSFAERMAYHWFLIMLILLSYFYHNSCTLCYSHSACLKNALCCKKI